jgi:hypothetical protein
MGETLVDIDVLIVEIMQDPFRRLDLGGFIGIPAVAGQDIAVEKPWPSSPLALGPENRTGHFLLHFRKNWTRRRLMNRF